jgi:hypothetical protein
VGRALVRRAGVAPHQKLSGRDMDHLRHSRRGTHELKNAEDRKMPRSHVVRTSFAQSSSNRSHRGVQQMAMAYQSLSSHVLAIFAEIVIARYYFQYNYIT